MQPLRNCLLLAMLVATSLGGEAKESPKNAAKEIKEFNQCFKIGRIQSRLLCLKNLMKPDLGASIRTQYLAWLGQIDSLGSPAVVCTREQVENVTVYNVKLNFFCFLYLEKSKTSQGMVAFRHSPSAKKSYIDSIYKIP